MKEEGEMKQACMAYQKNGFDGNNSYILCAKRIVLTCEILPC